MASKRTLGRLWDRYVRDGLAEEESQSRAHTAARPPRDIDWTLVGVFIVSTVSLILLEYLGKNEYYWSYVHARPVSATSLDLMRTAWAATPGDAPPGWYQIDVMRGSVATMDDPASQLSRLLYWAAWCVGTYFVLPALYIVFVMRQPLSDFGLRLRGTMRHLWVYMVMFAVVLPLVWIVSYDAGFQLQYPFYRGAADDPTGFWIWELAYALQFFSLEFFFRGFMVHGLKRRLGAYGVLVMMIPYVMIHFGKPMPETFGAIIAGTVLGVLSLRTGSILLGFLIHVSVALAMDLVSLHRQGQLGALVEHLF